MGGDGKAGVAAVLDEVKPHLSPVSDEAEQIDLLGMRDVGASGTAAMRGPGRPAGSRNRRTTEWAGYILSRYASPLEVLAQIATASVDDLTRRLSCTALEAIQEKRHAAAALLPYLHQRMPLAVDVTNHRVVTLTIVDTMTSEEDGEAVQVVDVLQNQGVNDGTNEPV